MRIKDFKIGQRLFTGFITVLILLAVVWYTGKKAMSDIAYQLEIAKLVNTMLTDAQDAQAGALRYIIYDDAEFNQTVITEGDAVKSGGNTAKTKMKSATNKKVVDEALTAMQSYVDECVIFRDLQNNKSQAGQQRSEAANNILKGIKDLLDLEYQIARENSKSTKKVDERIYWLTIEMQEIRNAYNRVNACAQVYQLAQSDPDKQDKIAKEWLKELDILEKQTEKVEAMVQDPRAKQAAKLIDEGIHAYEDQVAKFRKINLDQRDAQDKQRAAAGIVMKKTRDVRNGVYDFIEDVEKNAGVTLMTVSIIALVTGLITAWYLTTGIVKPVKGFGQVLQVVANGDLTQQVDIDSKDEIGDMGNHLRQMVESLSGLVGKVKANTDTVATASEELSAVSNQLATGSEEMSSQASNVAGATEQVSSNINMMASASEEMSVNAGSVSAAAEQMSTNMNSIADAMERVQQAITEIESNAREGESISRQGMQKATTATETMKRLDKAAEEIGQVTEVIKRIAEQTNLLALNATIEAASAGEAGKGFAVVANEIKELANQSATAAEDIARRIEGVQSNTREAVEVIEDVSGVINHISQSSSVISNSVQEQASMASSISLNVTEAKNGADNIANAIAEVAKGAEDVSRNAGEAAKGANEVASNINGVNDAANDSRSGAHQVNTSANEMAKLSGELKVVVSGFKVN